MLKGIRYTLVIGRPPFQTKDVKEIYKRIRDNQYEFPSDRQVSHSAQLLIQQILTTDPQARPTLHEILDHAFFIEGTVPSHIPITAHSEPPFYTPPITRPQSLANLTKLRKQALLDQDQTSDFSISPVPSNKSARNAATSIAQQEREFQKAVQPGSPISALLSSARQPLIVSNSPSPRESVGVMRKLNGNPPPITAKGKQSVVSLHKGPLTDIREEEDGEEPPKANREIESQKARIVAQMVPSSSPDPQEDQENIPPAPKAKPKKTIAHIAHIPPVESGSDIKANGFDVVANTLTLAFEAKSQGKLFRQPGESIPKPIGAYSAKLTETKRTALDVDLESPKVFIVSWVDYCNKYGMGYALTDGSVGVHFNDSTTMVLAPNKQ